MAGKRRRKSQLIGNEANTFTEKYLPHKQQEKLNSHIEREQPQGIKHAQHSTSDVTHKLATVKAKGMHAANDEVFEHVDSHIMESMREELGHDLDFEFQLHPEPTQTHAEARLHDRELTRPTDRPNAKDKIDTHQAKISAEVRAHNDLAPQPEQTNHRSHAHNRHGFFAQEKQSKMEQNKEFQWNLKGKMHFLFWGVKNAVEPMWKVYEPRLKFVAKAAPYIAAIEGLAAADAFLIGIQTGTRVNPFSIDLGELAYNSTLNALSAWGGSFSAGDDKVSMVSSAGIGFAAAGAAKLTNPFGKFMSIPAMSALVSNQASQLLSLWRNPSGFKYNYLSPALSMVGATWANAITPEPTVLWAKTIIGTTVKFPLTAVGKNFGKEDKWIHTMISK